MNSSDDLVLCVCDSYRAKQHVDLPEPGRYATGILFVDKDADKVAAVEKLFEKLAHQASLQVTLSPVSREIPSSAHLIIPQTQHRNAIVHVLSDIILL